MKCGLLILLLNFLISGMPVYAKDPVYPVLIFDSQGDNTSLKNFRTSKAPFANTTEDKIPSREGLETLNISGSGEFNGATLQRIMKDLPNEGYVVDLRKESHGFLDNTPVSWYGFRNMDNKDRSPGSIKSSEQRNLEVLSIQRKARVYLLKGEGESFSGPRNISFKEAKPEEKFVKDNSPFGYMRFYVLDHYPPDNTQIDAFVEFVKKLPEGTWLHFHCHGGKGRTTTFMAMYDIIRNAKKVSFEDIIKRQYLLGGANLWETNKAEEWKIPLQQKRLATLQNFYEYVKDEEQGYTKRPFSVWLDKIKDNPKKSRFSIFGW